MTIFLPSIFLLTVLFSSSKVEAQVPTPQTFSVIINGFSDGVIDEADNLYYADLPIEANPFALCVYGLESAFTSSDNALTLALRLDSRVVWQANRDNPVSQNSTLTFSRDGNLVLANADGRVVWQTNTANKGVVFLELLPNGNLVLLDKSRGFVWQSFDYPTDTILVGQSLLPGDENKLASRISPYDNRRGPYSMVVDGGTVAFHYKTKRSPKSEIYSLMESIVLPIENTTLAKMTLESSPVDQEPFLYELKFNITLDDSSTYSVVPSGLELKYNTTYSFLQLGQDGNLRMYTYFDKLQQRFLRSPWEVTFTMFSRRLNYESECQLPERCGRLGVCEDNQCVACPTPRGLLGWSNKCAPPKLPSCSTQSAVNVDYYKIVGVDHFSSKFSGYGPVKLKECRDKCSKDCKCLGFFYRKDTSKCLVTAQLNTLTKVSNSSHLGFIKYPK